MSEFEKCIMDFVNERQVSMKGTINAMLDFKVESIKEREELCLSFPVLDWQLNPMGQMHGGMICTALDITMGCLSYATNGGHPNPTIDLHVRYLHGIAKGERLYVVVNILHAGRRMVQLEAHAFISDKITCVAQASASYMISNWK